eukprot:365126-Chlamydomonas_euryale.AAC.13
MSNNSCQIATALQPDSQACSAACATASHHMLQPCYGQPRPMWPYAFEPPLHHRPRVWLTGKPRCPFGMTASQPLSLAHERVQLPACQLRMEGAVGCAATVDAVRRLAAPHPLQGLLHCGRSLHTLAVGDRSGRAVLLLHTHAAHLQSWQEQRL